MAENYYSMIPLLAVLVSLLAVPLIMISGRRPNLRESWTLMAALAKFLLVLSLLPRVLQGQNAFIEILSISPGVQLALRVDALGVFFALIASSLWILTSFYSIGYVRGLNEHKQTRYFASFAVCLSATIGIAFSANLLTFLIFYEVLTIATYPLVIHKETEKAIRAGRKYLAFTLSAGLILIVATAWLYQVVGSLDFRAGGIIAEGLFTPGAALTLFVLFFAGVGVKAAVMPLHGWLPTAMAAPTPVSALLHAVAVVKSGVFGVMRISGFVFGPQWLKEHGVAGFATVLAAFTIIIASLLAFRQDNLKRRLAYSTVAHLSYIVLGAFLLSYSGYFGGLLHIAGHASMKITLFFCAGAIYVNLHRENISELDGIGRKMPWTMGAFTLAALGLAGVPPLNGFVSKWFLGLGAVEGGQNLVLLVLVLSGLLNAAYFLPISYRAFFKSGQGLEKHGEASALMVVPLVLTAFISLLLGLFPDLFFSFFKLAGLVAGAVFAGGG